MAPGAPLSVLSLLLLSVVSLLQVIQGRDLYVDSSVQERNASCTSPDNACMSLEHAIRRSRRGDVIHIARPASTNLPYIVQNVLDIKWSLTFQAATLPPTIKCPIVALTPCQFDVSPEPSSNSTTTIAFHDVVIDGCSLCLKNASLLLDQVNMTESVVEAFVGHRARASLHDSRFKQTRLRFSGFCDRATNGASQCPGDTALSLDVARSSMTGLRSGLSVTNVSDVDAVVADTRLTRFSSEVHFTVEDHLKLTVSNLSITRFSTLGPALVLDCPRGNMSVAVRDSQFLHNSCVTGGCVTALAGSAANVDLTFDDVQFTNNTGNAAGSAIDLEFEDFEYPWGKNGDATEKGHNVLISGCNFTDNSNDESAGAIYITGGNVTIRNTTFWRNAVTAQLSIPAKSAERKGAGGAIYAMGPVHLEIDGCDFVNNSANWFGGAVAGSGAMRITNSYFQNSDKAEHSNLGETLFLNGPVLVANLTVIIVHSINNVPLIWYSSKDDYVLQGIGDGYLNFHCPPGSQFRNDTLLELDIVAAYKDLFYFCDPCEDNTYSLQHGYRKGPLTDGVGTWSSDFQCFPCAYGGVCKQGHIKSQYNFWGYTHGDPPQVTLIACPDAYCCGQDVCDASNTCAPNRTGTLCGECKPGTSERLFTTECVADAECHDTWYMAVDVVSSVLTVGFFLFPLEIVGLVYKYLLWSEVTESDNPTFAGYIKSIFYFYQTVDFLKVQDNKAAEIVGIAIQPILSYLMSFRSIAVLIGACPFPGLNPVKKILLNAAPTLYVLALLGLLAAVYMTMKRGKKTTSSHYVTFQRQSSASPEIRQSFKSRLATACLSYFLYNYISISNTTFQLLSCIPVGGRRVLFVDGNVECVQPWQGIFIVVAVLHVCPLFLAVIVSRSLYDRDVINTKQLIASYFVPLPMLVYWGVLFCGKWRRLKGTPVETAALDDSATFLSGAGTSGNITKSQILMIIEEPFINHTNAESALYWEGILIFRRLVMSAIAAFAVEPLLGISLQTATCFIFLLWHIHVHPFGTKAANHFETVSLSVLTLIAICHIIQATLLSAGVPPVGPAKVQIFVTDWLEWLLLNIFPMLLVLALVLFLVARLFMCCGLAMKYIVVRTRESIQRLDDKEAYATLF